MKKEFSKNERAGKICGFRPEGTSIDFPVEFHFQCPRRKTHNLKWSEYRYFLWCEQCNFDYPSPLCYKDRERAADVFLTIIEEARKK